MAKCKIVFSGVVSGNILYILTKTTQDVCSTKGPENGEPETSYSTNTLLIS
jgi:hypothetical protein